MIYESGESLNPLRKLNFLKVKKDRHQHVRLLREYLLFTINHTIGSR